MKRYLQTMILSGLLIGGVLAGTAGAAAAADTCGSGISEPPFLAYGINSNLLMMLDNSGSMLDMAYVDPNNQCFDETFTPCDPTDPNAICYAGNHDLTVPDTGVEAWYKWVQGAAPWANKAYAVGDIVSAKGTFYKALNAGTSSGASIDDDDQVTWGQLLRPSWDGSATYHAHSFVFDNDRGLVFYTRTGGAPPAPLPATMFVDSRFSGANGYQVPRWQSNTYFAPGKYVITADLKLYYTVTGGTTKATATKLTNDDAVEWLEADYHGWRPQVSYRVGDIATTNGMVYTCTTAHLSAGTTLYEDDFAANWQRLDEGYFQLLADETAARNFCSTVATPAHLNSTKNEYFENGDACATINNPGSATLSQQLLAFAASGNFLNWAMSSKFDIQKDILTGGKFNDEAQRVIAENRGCAGSRFIKQVAIQQTSPLNQPMKITMTIRRATDTDRVDSSDDTTRFEVYAITANGMNFAACQAAIEGFGGTGLGPAEQDVADCVGIPATGGQLDEHTIYHKAMQACWYKSKHGDWKGGNDFLLVAGGCQDIYWPDNPLNPGSPANIFPANIGLADPYRVCYGIYDTIPHDQRPGYVGRCWKPGAYVTVSGDTCQQVTCDYGSPAACTSATGTLPCYYTVSGIGYRCSPDKFLDECSGNFNSVQKTCNKAWVDVWRDTVTGQSCTPSSVQAIGFWEADFDSDLTIDNNTAEETSYNACVEAGLLAYCQTLDMPEVIDPSDEASSTEEVWNLPGILIDSGVVGQLGGNPLLVARGYILQTSQPKGILHETATDLRVGAMAFNANGAATECVGAIAPVDKYCPKTNKDGARVITPIRLGGILTDDANSNNVYDEGDRRHVDDLVTAINGVRATSWTPLAEAMYNAIGYFTQNTAVRLNGPDFQTDEDVFAGWVNNQEYAPGSYVLVGNVLYQTVLGGISSGDASNLAPADPAARSDLGVVWKKIGTYRGEWTSGTQYDPYDIVRTIAADTVKKLYITYSGGTAALKSQAPEASPLFDLAVNWEPLLDPVARWCQENHVLLITEGASTADVSPRVVSFTAGTDGAFNTVPIIDGDDTAVDNPPETQCTNGLEGSTYLDDLTYFGHDPEDEFTLYPGGNATLPAGDYPFAPKEKRNITTHIVVSGSLRAAEIGADPAECNPVTLMTSAAANGGTRDYLLGENPAELRRQLLEVFSELRQRASAGSAASVISSARGGEGAIYQAIFWPQLTRKDAGGTDHTIAWAGDVHGLFLDNRGFMFEDTNGDRTLRPYEDIDGDGWVDQEEGVGEDIDLDGHFDNVNEDRDGDGHLDLAEDLNNNGILDDGEDIDLDGHLDAFWHDLNGNGVKDPGEGEDLDGDGRLDTGEDVNHNGVVEASEDLDGDGPDWTEDLNNNGVFEPYIDLSQDINTKPLPGCPGPGDCRRDIEEQLSYPGYTSDRSQPDGDDKRVIIYFDEALGRSRACYDTSIYTQGDCAAPVELTDVKFLWSVNEWLADPALVTGTNRATFLSNEQKRHIFTWNDLDNDAVVDATEILDLDSSVNWDTLSLSVAGGRGPVPNDFNMANNTEVQKYVSWLRGEDIFPPSEDLNKNGILDAGEDANANGILDLTMRSRTIPISEGSGSSMVWRLGDIIHSTPMTVAAPAEGYHLIYNDFTYAQFLGKHKGRRHVVYFGANDGMLHAVNAGFYSESDKKFCLVPLNANGNCPANDDAGVPPALGSEMWAYVPYNLQPHLKCLADPAYVHKYYVDQRPRIFDVQIFAEEGACRTTVDGVIKPAFDTAGCIHPNGWGTILVGGMRFGGAPVKAVELNGVGTDIRKFTSSWFIMDITDPETVPVLLGEVTSNTDASTVNLGYSVGMPTLAIMKDKDNNINDANFMTKWYLVLGSGPVDGDVIDGDPAGLGNTNALRGVSDLKAKVSVFPLDWLTTNKQPLRISPLDPTVTGAESGTYTLNDSVNGFVSDMITVDYDINPSYEEYKSDVIYFGTVEGDFGTNADGTTYWNGGGRMYRLVNKEIQSGVTPWGGDGSTYGRGSTEPVTFPKDWTTNILLDLSVATGNNQPITAAPSVGTDGYNFWIYFGTGRFFDAYDKTDNTQHSYYGIKEPAVEVVNGLNRTKYLTWNTVELDYFPADVGDHPGEKGLWRVDNILVGQSFRIKDSQLTCRNNLLPCLPTTLQGTTLFDLDQFIAGTGLDRYEGLVKTGPTPPSPPDDPCKTNGCVDGWYRDFYPYENRERNVGQATLLGGLVTYTTYQPYNDVCQAEGNAYLGGLYYRTGTAWHKNIFGDQGVDGGNVVDKLNLGRGLATTPNLHVGSSNDPDSKEGPKAFIQTSTGEIREIEQENLPIENYRTGRSKWRQCN